MIARLLLALWPLATLAQSDYSVRLFHQRPPAAVRIAPAGDCRVRTCAGCAERLLSKPLAVKSGDAPVSVRGAYSLEAEGAPALALDFPLDIKTQRGALAITLRMPREEYVAGVLAGEGSVMRSAESLKAMAVAIRTYAVRHLGRHKQEGFDFCDTTHCQDLRLAARSGRLQEAVQETEGELLWHQGAPAYTFYHRHCGGRTEAVRYVWPGLAAPYLPEQEDTFCTSSGRASWKAEIPGDELAAALGLPALDRLAVVRRSPSGRALELTAQGRRVDAANFHHAVGRNLGWHLLRSASYDALPAAGRFLFQGHGAGHGVGLCQAGAARRGEAGHTYRQILAFYYPGTALGVNAQGFAWHRLGGERVDLFSTRPADDRLVVEAADRALRDAESAAGFTLDFRPRIRVYPTVAAFRDATGEPGWVAASVSGRTVRMQSSGRLRAAGGLETTLRHEFLHLLIESRARPDTPDWFREGLALALEPAPANARADSAARRRYAQWRACAAAVLERHGRNQAFAWLERGLPRALAACE